MNETLYIVAASGQAARDTALTLGLPRSPGAAWRYVSSGSMLRGRSRLRVHYVPGWEGHPSAEAIRVNIDIIGAAGDVVVV